MAFFRFLTIQLLLLLHTLLSLVASIGDDKLFSLSEIKLYLYIIALKAIDNSLGSFSM